MCINSTIHVIKSLNTIFQFATVDFLLDKLKNLELLPKMLKCLQESSTNTINLSCTVIYVLIVVLADYPIALVIHVFFKINY